MKPRAASCAVGSELGLLFTFHKSFEPVNPACKALCPRFYSTIAVTVWHFSSLSACRATAGHSVLHSPSGEEDHIVLPAGWSIWSCLNACVCLSACLHVRVSARRFMKNDQMTRWAVINELSTEHFWPSGKRVPWQSRPASGHRGRGAAAQRALCLCQEPPEDSCMGPAHLDNTMLLTALHLSVLNSEKSW